MTGYPDGMCIDSEDMLWIAVFRGSKVIRIDPKTRKVLEAVTLPYQEVTSLAFGGPNLDILYVTTGSIEDHKNDEHAGLLYQITGLGVQGVPAVRANL